MEGDGATGTDSTLLERKELRSAIQPGSTEHSWPLEGDLLASRCRFHRPWSQTYTTTLHGQMERRDQRDSTRRRKKEEEEKEEEEQQQQQQQKKKRYEKKEIYAKGRGWTKEQANRANGRQTRLSLQGRGRGSRLATGVNSHGSRRGDHEEDNDQRPRAARWPAIFFDPFAARTRYADTWLSPVCSSNRGLAAGLLPTRTSRGDTSARIMRNCVSRSTRKVGLARRKVAWERDPDECRESRRKISLVSFRSSYLLANLVLVS